MTRAHRLFLYDYRRRLDVSLLAELLPAGWQRVTWVPGIAAFCQAENPVRDAVIVYHYDGAIAVDQLETTAAQNNLIVVVVSRGGVSMRRLSARCVIIYEEPLSNRFRDRLISVLAACRHGLAEGREEALRRLGGSSKNLSEGERLFDEWYRAFHQVEKIGLDEFKAWREMPSTAALPDVLRWLIAQSGQMASAHGHLCDWLQRNALASGACTRLAQRFSGAALELNYALALLPTLWTDRLGRRECLERTVASALSKVRAVGGEFSREVVSACGGKEQC